MTEGLTLRKQRESNTVAMSESLDFTLLFKVLADFPKFQTPWS